MTRILVSLISSRDHAASRSGEKINEGLNGRHAAARARGRDGSAAAKGWIGGGGSEGMDLV